MPTTWSTTDNTSMTLSGGNLVATLAGAQGGVRSIDRVSNGKYYWEVTYTAVGAAANTGVGIAAGYHTLSLAAGSGSVGSCILPRAGNVFYNGNATGVSLGALVAGSVACIALDLINRLIWFRIGAGNWNAGASNNPATGVGGISIASTFTVSQVYALAYSNNTNDALSANFGATAFAQSAPSGFVGFPSGTTLTNNAASTQTALEQWLMPLAAAQATSVAIEMWAPGGTTTPRAVATLVALEQWAPAGIAVTPTAQARAWIMA